MACDARSCKCRWALGASHCGRCSATVNHTAIYAYSHSAASTAHKNNSCGSKGPLLPTLAGSVTSIQLSYTPTTCAVQEDAFTDWLTYVLIFVVIFTAVAQMKCAYRCTHTKPTGCDSPSHSFASVRLSSAERPWPWMCAALHVQHATLHTTEAVVWHRLARRRRCSAHPI